MLAWIAARCLDTSRQRPSAIVAMIFSNLIAQSGSGCLAHRNQPRVRQAASSGRPLAGSIRFPLRQSFQPLQQIVHLPAAPKSVATGRWNAASDKFGGDGIRRCDAARLDVSYHRGKRDGSRIRPLFPYFAASRTSFRGRNHLHRTTFSAWALGAA